MQAIAKVAGDERGKTGRRQGAAVQLGDQQDAGRRVGIKHAHGFPQAKIFLGADVATITALAQVQGHWQPCLA